MKKSIYIFVLLFFFSCKNEEKLQLATANATILEDIQDHSPVYFFFRISKNDTLAEINKRNTISSTNWVFHIDKRLPLHCVATEISTLQEKKKLSPHKKEGTINVFSYMNSSSKSLAFLPFPEVVFSSKTIFLDLKKVEEKAIKNDSLPKKFLYISKDETFMEGKSVANEKLIEYLNTTFSQSENPIVLQLCFQDNLLFENYIAYKVQLVSGVSSNIKLNNVEYMYSKL